MPVHNIRTPDEFQETIANNSTVIIDFFATQCEHSKMLAPIFVEQSNRDEYRDIVLAKVDVDEVSGVAGKLGITTTPTFQLYKGGKVRDDTVSPGPQALLQFIAQAR